MTEDGHVATQEWGSGYVEMALRDELCSPTFICLSPNPGIQSVTIFGNRAFKEVIKIKLGHLIQGGSQPNMTDVLTKRGDQDTNTQRDNQVKTEGKGGHLLANKRGFREN